MFHYHSYESYVFLISYFILHGLDKLLFAVYVVNVFIIVYRWKV